LLLADNTLSRNDNGVVSDSSTSLQWQDNISSVKKDWEDAIGYCSDLTLDGYSDWRLPNKNELLSIVDYSKYNPSIKEDVFQNIESSYCWSSTTYATNTSNAWNVDFDNGYARNGTKDNSLCVRCVRVGQ
jgi:hypothetical protein